MVNKATNFGEINDLSIYHPPLQDTRRHSNIRWPTMLYDQILAEAKRREWSFSHMVRHLCEASIDGIE